MKITPALKKTCGDKLSKFIAINFNQSVIIDVIRKSFNNNGKDIKHIAEDEFDTLKRFLNFTMETKTEEEKEPQKVKASKLLHDAGYDLIRVKTQDEAKKFKKYFRSGEGLCKFQSSSTYSATDVYFMIKHDVNDIEPFENPKRQDDYSTSVMSTKISKDGQNVLQITSRYNHTVGGCDNTFNSDLDSICEGLADAFNYEFGYKLKRKSAMFEFDKFVEFDNTFVYYHHEIDGIKIGDNTLVTDKIVNYSYDRFYTYSYYIIDLQEKKIIWDGIFDSQEGFVEYFNEAVKKIEFVKNIDDVDDNDSDEVCYIQK